MLLTLDALTIAPDHFYDGKNDIFWRCAPPFGACANAKRDADIAKVEDLLWQTALKLERGGLLSAAEESAQAAGHAHAGAGRARRRT